MMSERQRGTAIQVTAGRRLVLELMHQSRHVPLVTLRREFAIPTLVALRAEARPKISWVALFAKAYSLAARKHAHLRRNWLTFPFRRIYEHPNSECVVLVEREWQGEDIVLGGKLRAPEDMPIGEIDRHIRRFQREPIQSISSFRQLARIASFPAILRRFIFWSTLNCSGYKRCKRFGTFMISSLGNYGCELLAPHMPLTGYLTFGPISADGHVAVCLAFDHRVMDGRHAARALEDMESILNTKLLTELRLERREATTPENANPEIQRVRAPARARQAVNRA
jgi:hypothetical protein